MQAGVSEGGARALLASEPPGNLSFAWRCASCTTHVSVLLQIQQHLLSSVFSLFARKQNQLVLPALLREVRPGAKGATFSAIVAMASIPLFHHQ